MDNINTFREMGFDLSRQHSRAPAFLAAFSVLYRRGIVTVSAVIDQVAWDTRKVLTPSYTDKLLNQMASEGLATRKGAGKRGSPRQWIISEKGKHEFEQIAIQEAKKSTFLTLCAQAGGQWSTVSSNGQGDEPLLATNKVFLGEKKQSTSMPKRAETD